MELYLQYHHVSGDLRIDPVIGPDEDVSTEDIQAVVAGARIRF